MPTPLGLARSFQLRFREFHDVRIVREGPFRLRLYCLLPAGLTPPSDAEIEAWLKQSQTAGTLVEFSVVSEYPAGMIDEEILLARTTLKRVVVEHADVTVQGFITNLQRHFGSETILGSSDPNGHVTVHVAPDVDEHKQEEIVKAARVLLCSDVRRLSTSSEVPGGRTRVAVQHSQLSDTARAAITEDREFLEDHLPDALDTETHDSIPMSPLPSGAATFASPVDGADSLIHRLALFDVVYLAMPTKVEECQSWIGYSLEEILDASSTGRIVPILCHPPDRYEAAIVDGVVNESKERILHGEFAIRSMRQFMVDHPAVPEIVRNSPEIAILSHALQDEGSHGSQLLASYLDSLSQAVDRMNRVALVGPTMALAWYPIGEWLDTQLASKLELSSRSLELSTAVDYSIAVRALQGTPMSVEGHYLDGYLRLVCGVYGGDTEIVSIPEPQTIADIVLPELKGHQLREFAEQFNGGPIIAMRELMRSPRLHSGEPIEQVVRQFNEECRQYRTRATTEYAALVTLLTGIGIFGSLGAPAALAALSIELCRSIMERRAPVVLSSLTAFLTQTKKEGALLARIRGRT